jgi:hypothetical protein
MDLAQSPDLTTVHRRLRAGGGYTARPRPDHRDPLMTLRRARVIMKAVSMPNHVRIRLITILALVAVASLAMAMVPPAVWTDCDRLLWQYIGAGLRWFGTLT